jgi:hypothetical protein
MIVVVTPHPGDPYLDFRMRSNVFNRLPNYRESGFIVLLIPQSRQSAKLFLQSLELGLSQPLTRRRVCPPPPQPPVLRWGAHSLAREGLGES